MRVVFILEDKKMIISIISFNEVNSLNTAE